MCRRQRLRRGQRGLSRGRPPRRVLAGGQCALLGVAPHRRGVDAQVLGRAVHTLAGLQAFGEFGQHVRIDNAVALAALARPCKARLAVLLQTLLGAPHGARREAEGGGQLGLLGEAQQGQASQLQIAGGVVIAGMRGDRQGEHEIDEAVVVVAQQAQAGAEGQRLAGQQGIGGRLGGGWVRALGVNHRTYYIKRKWAQSSPSGKKRMALTLGHKPS